MVFVIMSSAVERNQCGRSWVAKALTFTASSVLAGASMGAMFGAIGAQLELETRLAASTVLGLIGACIGLVELSGRAIQVIERRRETSQRLMRLGGLLGSAVNGALLGLGATTRLGYWLWYAVPIGALLSGSVVLGFAIYGAYGLARGLGPWMFFVVDQVRAGQHPYRLQGTPMWLLTSVRGWARLTAATDLTVVGIAAMVVSI